MKKVAFIGVGKLGGPCAEAMSKLYDVVGYDIVPQDVSFPMLPTVEQAVEGRELIFIAVPTPHDPAYDGSLPTSHLPKKDFDYSIVTDILNKLDRVCTKDQLVVLISTVLPGTVRREFVPLTSNYRFIYNPYLIALGSVAWDMINPEMVIIGTEDGSTTGDAQLLIDFYQPLMQNDPRYVVGTWDEAEAIKIFYNTFISTKVGLVNMIMDVAEQVGNMNVDVVTQALAHSDMRITGPKYMKAGMGDSGACHPRDNIALRWLSEDLGLGYDLFDAIMTARERQARNIARLMVVLAENYKLEHIWIHGKAYKPNVPNCEGSYSLLIGHYIEEMGRKVKYVDPLTGDVHSEVHGVVLMAHHAPTTYDNTAMEQIKQQNFYCGFKPGSVIVDVWRYLTQADVPKCTLVSYGNTRAH